MGTVDREGQAKRRKLFGEGRDLSSADITEWPSKPSRSATVGLQGADARLEWIGQHEGLLFSRIFKYPSSLSTFLSTFHSCSFTY